MHGVVLTSLREYVAATHGPVLAGKVFAGTPAFVLSEAYPDEVLHRLFDRVVEETGGSHEALLHDFGVFTARRTFVRLYPAFFAIATSPRDFLLTVETRIHELVRATIREATPPQLRVTPEGDDGVRIEYDSPRRLCVFLRGLVDGTAAHYGERAAIEEQACMHRGDAACVFHVRLSGGSAGAAGPA